MLLAEWLEKCNMFDIRKLRLEIGNEVWDGCEYRTRDRREFIYLLGEVPKARRKRESTCFTLAGDSREWFVAGGWTNYLCPWGLKEEFATFHPFGQNWSMCPWGSTFGEKIDTYERFPYKRVPMEITYL